MRSATSGWPGGAFQRANIVRKGSRRPDQTDILVPDGFKVEVVATDLNEPAAANRFEFAVDDRFGFLGDAFVACFGDGPPGDDPAHRPGRVQGGPRRHGATESRRLRRQPDPGQPSVLPHNEFERPSDCRFGPDGSLYVVDWGEMVPAPERGGVEIRMGTGILWRIRRTAGAGGHGEVPPKPLLLPVNLLRAVIPAAGVAGATAPFEPHAEPAARRGNI